METTFDVCILGGGPAGLAAAIALAQTGRRVSVVDAATPPIDKACGEGLMPDSVHLLRQLGITIPAEAGYPFRGIRFVRGEIQVSAAFPKGCGIGLRRTVLHGLLKRRADELGIQCAWGRRATLQTDGTLLLAQGQQSREVWKADVTVAADGQNSPARRTGPLRGAVARQSSRYGFRRHYRMAPWCAYVELYWGRDCQIYITPVAADEVCVASVGRDSKLRLDAALAEFPELLQRISDATQVSPDRGAVSVTRRLRRVCAPGFALLGDASGSVDAVTGEGLCLSFRQALRLAEAIDSGDLTRYEQAHRALSRLPRTMAQMLLMMDRSPGFQRRALEGLARHPAVFESLLAVHVGERSFTHLLTPDLFHLCRTFLAA